MLRVLGARVLGVAGAWCCGCLVLQVLGVAGAWCCVPSCRCSGSARAAGCVGPMSDSFRESGVGCWLVAYSTALLQDC
jgi:hypothetical protein